MWIRVTRTVRARAGSMPAYTSCLSCLSNSVDEHYSNHSWRNLQDFMCDTIHCECAPKSQQLLEKETIALCNLGMSTNEL